MNILFVFMIIVSLQSCDLYSQENFLNDYTPSLLFNKNEARGFMREYHNSSSSETFLETFLSALDNSRSVQMLPFDVFNSYLTIQEEGCSSAPTVPQPKEHEIIIVHGTFAAHYDWYLEGGDFYEAVLQSAKTRFGENVGISPFRWTGYLGAISRIDAATLLAERIISSNKKIYTIGHSHGGNVINLASQILELSLEPIDKDEHYQKISKIAKKLFDKEHAETEKLEHSRHISHSSESLETIKDVLCCSLVTIAQAAALAKTRNNFDYSVKIEENYLLATPVDVEDMAPSDKIVKRSFNLFSRNDMVQPVFGLYGRTYGLPRDVVTDMSVAFVKWKGSDTVPDYDYPSHVDLHSPTVGGSLFLIPQLCLNAVNTCSKDGVLDIVFYKDFPEVVSPELKTIENISGSVFESWIENFHEMASWFI